MSILPDKRIGVYQIRNTVNGKVYIGSTSKGFRYRWIEHLSALRRNEHHCQYLQRSWNKYGETAFAFEILEVITESDHVIEREQIWLDLCRADGRKLYNAAPKAGSTTGYRFTDDQRATVSAMMRRRMEERPDLNVKLREASNRYWSSTDTRQIQSERVRGHMADSARRNRSSEAARDAWESGVYAERSSPEYGAKISSAKAWRVWSDLIAPDGSIHGDIRNLTVFCKEHGLHKSAMTRLYQGKQPSHKGWRLHYPVKEIDDSG